MSRWRALALVGLLCIGTAAGAQESRGAILAHAARLQTAGEYGDAVDLLRPWVYEHPADTEVSLLLGQILMDGGRADAAVQTWRGLLATHRGSGRIYRTVIDRLRRCGLTGEAMRVMEEAHRELDDPRPYAWDLAELYLQEEEYERAVAALLAYLGREPQRLSLIDGRLLSLARAERASGRGGKTTEGDATPGARTAGLLRALDRAAANSREAGEGTAGEVLAAHVLLGSIALEAGQERRALEAYTAIAPLPEAGLLVFQFASRCAAAGEYETAAEAYALFGAHSAESPYRFQALLRQAEAEESAGRSQRAASLYRQLSEAFPNRPEALDALLRAGRLHLSLGGDQTAARAAFEQVLALDRAGRLRASALQLLAECEVRAGDLESARDRYEALLATGEEAQPAAHFGLAEVALYQGRFEAATAHGDSLMARHPAHDLANDALELQLLVDEFGDRGEALAAYARGLLLERQGLAEEAAKAWEWVTEHGPDDLRAHSLLRRARFSGRPRFSLTLFDRVLATWPGTPFALQARLGRAGILERLGDPSEALTEYERALLAFAESARAPEMRLEIQRLRRLASEEGAR